MSDITKLDLDKSQPKFISVGSNVFVSSTGKSEVCRKGQQGLFCRRHHGSSYSSQPEVRAMLDKHANRTIEKLSPFENGCIWLYSVLMRTTIDEARKHYIESTAMYTLLGVRKPTDIEVKGLQKALMGLIESSRIQDTRMDQLKKLIKNMAFGKGFTEAGFYTLKDMTKETLNKIKMGFVGLSLGSSLLLTGCAGQNPINSFSNIVQPSEEQNFSAGIPKETTVAKVSDQYGDYTRTGANSTSDMKSDIQSGINAKDAKSVQDFAIKFITEEALDSIALDDASSWEKWASDVAPKYLASSYMSDILGSESTNSGTDIFPRGTAVILTDVDNAMPTLLRDGGTRSAKKMFSSIVMTKDPDSDTYYFNAVGQSNYYVSDESIKSFYREQYGNKDFDTWETFNDGKAQILPVTFNISYTIIKEDGAWKIAGFGNEFSVVTSYSQQSDASNKVPSDRINN
jgi:hypothetical protein